MLPRETNLEKLLQCGHGPKTVENSAGRAVQSGGVQASMRPRPEDRGEPPTAPPCDDAAHYGASMRPRPEDRGERPTTSNSTRPSPRFNAATARRPWRTNTRSVIQCCAV